MIQKKPLYCRGDGADRPFVPESTEKNEDKTIRVTFSGGFSGDFTEEEYFKYDLYALGEPGRMTLRELLDAVNGDRAYALTASLARASLKPTGFLRARLEQEGFDAAAEENAMERLEEAGYLDDMRYAASFVQKKAASGNASSRMILGELLQKGVPTEIAEQALAENCPEEREIAERLARKKKKEGCDREKTARYLMGKGFGSGTLRRVLDSVFAED